MFNTSPEEFRKRTFEKHISIGVRSATNESTASVNVLNSLSKEIEQWRAAKIPENQELRSNFYILWSKINRETLSFLSLFFDGNDHDWTYWQKNNRVYVDSNNNPHYTVKQYLTIRNLLDLNSYNKIAANTPAQWRSIESLTANEQRGSDLKNLIAQCESLKI